MKKVLKQITDGTFNEEWISDYEKKRSQRCFSSRWWSYP